MDLEGWRFGWVGSVHPYSPWSAPWLIWQHLAGHRVSLHPYGSDWQRYVAGSHLLCLLWVWPFAIDHSGAWMASLPSLGGILNCCFVWTAVCTPHDWANTLDWNPSAHGNHESERVQMAQRTDVWMHHVQEGLPVPWDFLISLMDKRWVWLWSFPEPEDQVDPSKTREQWNALPPMEAVRFHWPVDRRGQVLTVTDRAGSKVGHLHLLINTHGKKNTHGLSTSHQDSEMA